MQSYKARLLLRLALSRAKLSISDPLLALPGTELIKSIREQFGIETSITHCSEMVGIALGRTKLGLDCEALGRKRNWLGIADQFFTPMEADVIRRADAVEQERLFLQHWTLKEAFIKAIQGSIFGDLNQLTLLNGSKFQLMTQKHEPWHAWQIDASNCLISICSQQERPDQPRLYECTDLSRSLWTIRKEHDAIRLIPSMPSISLKYKDKYI
jgi:phosphopantetheine--protein transferase-like protein